MSFFNLPIKRNLLLASCLTPLIFTGCIFSTQSVTYDSSTPYIKIDEDATTVKLSGVEGKTITYMVLNKSSSTVTPRTVLTSQKALELNSSNQDELEIENDIPPLYANTEGFKLYKDLESNENIKIYAQNFEDPARKFTKFNYASNSSRSAVSFDTSSSSTTYSDSNFTVGSTKKTFYVLYDEDLSDYTKTLSFTLRAKGYSDGTYTTTSKTSDSDDLVCYVWVADIYYSSGSGSGSEVDSNKVAAIASTFGKYKAAETNLIGEESSHMLYSTDGSTVSKCSSTMASTSATGTVVNILVYDIGKDYTYSSSKGGYTNGGVVGFFVQKDYYTQDTASCFTSGSDYYNYFNSSNEGKFFYIDSAWCNYNSDATSYSTLWDSSEDVSATVISTLFHEFQHMVNFGNKKGYSSSWFDEMMSMLVEDVMQPIIGYDENEAPAPTRLPLFNYYYQITGADTWLSGDYMVYSYSSAYAFGAYITRNYDGAKLISEMSKNNYYDWSAITKAIYTVTGKTVTQESLVTEWALAGCYPTTQAKAKGLPCYYNTPSPYTTGDYTYSLKPINLFSYNIYGYTSYYGPAIFSTPEDSFTLNPSQFLHMSIGTATADTVRISLSGKRTDSNEELYILIHDYLYPTVQDTYSE